MIWQISLAASIATALAYFAIFWLIGSGLWRTDQVTSNRLGVTTAAIFFSCGVGHALHAEHLITGPDAQALRAASHWHAAAWEAVTALVAFNFLALRRHYSRLLLPNSPVMFEDNTRQLFEDKLTFQAYHDSLTKLPNRAAFNERLEQALTAPGGEERTSAVLFLDLDRFKKVNDTLGHPAGDELLRLAASRLKECVRPGDVIARLGGDEFTVLVENAATPDAATLVAERAGEQLRRPFYVEGRELALTVSVGIAFGVAGRDSSSEVMRRADLAMHKAKANGKARYEMFSAQMGSGTSDELELRSALERREFELHFQPQVSLELDRLAGFEALVRWRHPQRGLLAPVEFIPAAEATGQIVPLGRWVIAEACARASEWRRNNPLVDPAPFVSVNLSARELREPGLPAFVFDALHASGLEPEGLLIEITEGAVMEDRETGIAVLEQLREVGVRVALDDFGTGYSSLSQLNLLPLDLLKIDRSFINEMGKTEAEAVVKAFIELSHTLGMKTTAEGVESRQERSRLRRMGCDLAQGFLFAEPLSSQAAAQLVATGRPLAMAG